ncbi:ATP-dependent DNA helicase Q4 [Harpegnathos saltator]|uniref:DNA 3'-5' helicase n=1 Tax=Harpegnathos saltator TaxID=610380 RepID=E2BI65_HARSA|nr:ATP-dependent DNA helicase Q4 [Harpegnathos saltator]EFN84636.1 ATP-dependent DNA helicase Q4 [Harpegnathos saltator]
MEFLENPVFKTKYLKNKLRVKLWESDFMEKYGRKPNKNDIKEADAIIKESYKMYWKLKTRALEETLTDITFCDDVRDNVSNASPQKPTGDEKHDKKPSPEKITKDAENIHPHNKLPAAAENLVEKSDSANVKGVWGDHLNKSKEQAPKKKQSLLIGRSSSFQLSRNKFESSSFTKRNPRKLLSSTKIRTKPEKTSSSQSSVDRVEAPDVRNDLRVAAETKLIFGDPVKVTFEGSKPMLHSINAVQQLVDGHVAGVTRNLDQGWLDRCARDSNREISAFVSQRLSNNSDSGVESMESSIHSPKDIPSTVMNPAASPMQFSDEEDFICNSDSEEERRNKRVGNLKKRLSDQEGRPAKRLCVEIGRSEATDANTFESTLNIHASVNPVHSESKTDDIHGLKLTPDVDASFEPSNESARTLNVCRESACVGSDVVLRDKVTTESTSWVKTDRTKCTSKTVNTAAELAGSASREDSSFFVDEPAKQLTSHRRAKQVPVNDDSDPDYVEQSKKSRKAKTKTKKSATGTRSVKKPAGQRSKKKATSNAETANMRRSAKTRANLQEDDEERNSGSKAGTVPIYGVETIEAVPRFAMNPTTSGDLIAQCSESVSAAESEKDVPVLARTKTKLTDKEKLEKKMATGTMNDNFVRINLKKKVFVRGKKNFNFSKYKKNQWKQRKKDLASSESNLDAADLMDKNGMTCFKCGESGHFARNCTVSKGEALLPLEEIDESSNFPTLQEAEKMASQGAIVAHSHRIDRLPQRPSFSTEKASDPQHKEEEKGKREEETVEEVMAKLFSDDFADPVEEKATPILGHKIPKELLSRLLPPLMEVVNPLYPTNQDGGLVETPTEVFEALRLFGHESFRAGQEKAVMRVLSGRSTLVTLSTGSGKSLCYQLPAYLYSQHSRCITLVISPLVSLMDDQVTGVPLFLSAACLHTGQSPKVREQVMQAVKDGKVNILLVSPEAVVAGEKSTGFGALLRQLPPIAFACIDEAHCISQWSHNFRPSYLMLCRVLKEKLGVKTVLGLTATATRATAESIVNHLDLPDGMAGVISDVPMPRNLVLTVSKDGNKDHGLIALLRSERFQECDSVIVYCTRREECARIAGLLRVSLQDSRNSEKPNAKMSTIAEAYHAGMTALRRKVVQKEFMSGKIKIVVATVAFGMGINKANIRAVIHYNMPSTFESYVQEVGRAGRDGLPAHCHLFLNPMEDSDKWELRRHIHANGIDRHTIRHLLQRIFIPCSCAKINAKDSGRRCPGHEVALSIDETVQALDITEEIISTLLCYLELHPRKFITVLSSVYVRARISSYNGPQALKQAAQSSPPLAMAIALDMQKRITHEDSNVIEFPVIDVASAIGWDSGVVKSHLKDLEWAAGADGKMKRSAISVHYDKLGLRVKAPGDLSDVELDEALDALIARTRSQESSCLRQLEIISSALSRISVSSIKYCLVLDEDVAKKSEELKDTIRKYFQSDSPLDNVDISFQDKVPNEHQIAADVRSLVLCYRDTKFTGRAVARIFHGIQSPNYPAMIWGRCRFWRAHLAANFNGICRIAAKEILALR